MTVKMFTMDHEGYIIISNLIKALSFGLYRGKPVFWGVVDSLDKSAQSAKVICIKNDQSIDSKSINDYRGTFCNEKTDEVWHLFEEPSKIIKGNLNGLRPAK